MKLLKSKRFWLVIGFLLLACGAVLFSLKCQIAGTILSALGSIASLYAIIEALSRIKSLKEETHRIKIALDEKVESMNMRETTEQINKNIQIVARIQTYINNRNLDAAVILMEQLWDFLHSLNQNPTTDATIVEESLKFMKQLRNDIRNTRIEICDGLNGAGLKYKLLTRHFTDLEDFLNEVSQQNHFKNDK